MKFSGGSACVRCVQLLAEWFCGPARHAVNTKNSAVLFCGALTSTAAMSTSTHKSFATPNVSALNQQAASFFLSDTFAWIWASFVLLGSALPNFVPALRHILVFTREGFAAALPGSAADTTSKMLGALYMFVGLGYLLLPSDSRRVLFRINAVVATLCTLILFGDVKNFSFLAIPAWIVTGLSAVLLAYIGFVAAGPVNIRDTLKQPIGTHAGTHQAVHTREQ